MQRKTLLALISGWTLGLFASGVLHHFTCHAWQEERQAQDAAAAVAALAQKKQEVVAVKPTPFATPPYPCAWQVAQDWNPYIEHKDRVYCCPRLNGETECYAPSSGSWVGR